LVFVVFNRVLIVSLLRPKLDAPVAEHATDCCAVRLIEQTETQQPGSPRFDSVECGAVTMMLRREDDG
jgi:hypothetical protein